MKILKNKSNKDGIDEYPLIPLREMVIFPGMEKTFYVGRQESVEAVNLSLSTFNKMIFLVAQKDSEKENPGQKDIFKIGVISEIVEANLGPDKK